MSTREVDFILDYIRRTGKKFSLQSLDDAILELLEQGKISAKDAYFHCLNKQRFRSFLDEEPDDFDSF